MVKETVDKDAIRWLVQSDSINISDLARYVGIARTSIYKIADGSSKLGRLQVDNAVKLTRYAYSHGYKEGNDKE